MIDREKLKADTREFYIESYKKDGNGGLRATLNEMMGLIEADEKTILALLDFVEYVKITSGSALAVAGDMLKEIGVIHHGRD